MKQVRGSRLLEVVPGTGSQTRSGVFKTSPDQANSNTRAFPVNFE